MRALVRRLILDTLSHLKSQGTLAFDALPNFTVEVPKREGRGDWSSNVAMTLTRATGKKPDELARLLSSHLVDPQGVVAQVAVEGAFLNFTLKDAVFQQVARQVLEAGPSFGRSPPRSTGQRWLVEFVSANPTGPVHIGHARGAFMGDAIARLVEAAGHEVTREFYVNDFGKQVETLGRTVYKRYRETFGEPFVPAEGEYPADYVKDIAVTWRQEVGDRYLKSPPEEWMPAAVAVGIRENLAAIRATLAQAGITHDVFFSEASLHASGKVREVVERYKQRGVTYEADRARPREASDKRVRAEDSKAAKFAEQQLGGTFLMTSTYQENGKYVLKDDEDRILLRKDGTPVYLTSDLAYHHAKYERGFDVMVNVFGADHAGHVPRLESGVRLLGHDPAKLKFVLVQIVRILRGGQEVKVSKRRGTLFELADLIEEAGPDVCRFLFLTKTREAQFDFDLDLVQQQSKDNPVFYFQYGHARCAAILRKAEEKGTPFVGLAGLSDDMLARLTLPEEKSLLKKMSQLPDVVVSAAERLEPHHVLYFCQELIGDFHSYYTQYRSDPIISADARKTQGRLALVAALKQTLLSAFALLGIAAPEVMVAPEEG